MTTPQPEEKEVILSNKEIEEKLKILQKAILVKSILELKEALQKSQAEKEELEKEIERLRLEKDKDILSLKECNLNNVDLANKRLKQIDSLVSENSRLKKSLSNCEQFVRDLRKRKSVEELEMSKP